MTLAFPEGGARSRPPILSGRRRNLLLLPLAAVLLQLGAATANGHGGAARLQVTPDPVNPGGVVEVRGEDLSADEPMRIVLQGPPGELPIGDVTTDDEGHFVTFIQIPAELPTGTYAISAVDTTEAAFRAALEIAGAPLLQPGEPGGKDEDDMLLIPLPASWQRSLSSPIVTAVPVTAAGSEQVAGIAGTGLIAGLGLTLLALGGIGIVLASRLRRRRPPRPEPPRA